MEKLILFLTYISTLPKQSIPKNFLWQHLIFNFRNTALRGLAEIVEILKIVDGDLVYPHMTIINQRLIELIKSPRSHVCRTACQAVGHLFEYVKDTRRPVSIWNVETKTLITNNFIILHVLPTTKKITKQIKKIGGLLSGHKDIQGSHYFFKIMGSTNTTTPKYIQYHIHKTLNFSYSCQKIYKNGICFLFGALPKIIFTFRDTFNTGKTWTHQPRIEVVQNEIFENKLVTVSLYNNLLISKIHNISVTDIIIWNLSNVQILFWRNSHFKHKDFTHSG